MNAKNMSNKKVAVHAVANWFPNWTPNITVTVWGRGKATLVDKSKCMDHGLTGGQKHIGDCDNCRYWCGIKTIRNEAEWGERFKGCCGLLIDDDLPPSAA